MQLCITYDNKLLNYVYILFINMKNSHVITFILICLMWHMHANIIILHVDIIYLSCRGRSEPSYKFYCTLKSMFTKQCQITNKDFTINRQLYISLSILHVDVNELHEKHDCVACWLNVSCIDRYIYAYMTICGRSKTTKFKKGSLVTCKYTVLLS